MKKIISLMLVLVLCLGLFAGCNENPDPNGSSEPAGTTPSQPAENPLEAAVEYLYTMYKPAVKDEPTKQTSDKDFLAAVAIDGVSYKVEWTVNITAGPADGVTIGESSTANMVKLDIMDGPEEDIYYTLTATVTDGKNEPQSVSFDYYTPAVKKVEVEEGKILLYYPKEDKYVTEEVYEYTSSSGSKKNELVLGDKSAAVALTVRENDDKSVTFVTDSGKFLYCEGTNVHFVTEEGEFTKFYLENTDGGQLIKSSGLYNNDPAKPQYLEVYKGYVTCYGINDSSDLSIYTFQMQAVGGASQSAILDAAYALGEDEALEGTYTLTGVITKINTAWSEQYGNITVTIVCDGDTARPVECYRLQGEGAKTLAEGDTITVTGVIKNYKGKVEFDKGCNLDKVVKGEGNDTPDVPDVPVEKPAYLTSAPEAGKSYKLGLEQNGLGKNLYFTGNIYKTYPWYMDTTEKLDAGMAVTVEAVDGGYRLFFTKDGVKTYLDAHIDGTHYSLRLIAEPTAVWTWNAEYNTFVVDLDGTACFIGTSGTFTSLSCNKMEKIAESYPAHLYN